MMTDLSLSLPFMAEDSSDPAHCPDITMKLIPSLTICLFQQKCGVIVYDDLNHPHLVEGDHDMLAAYTTSQVTVWKQE